MYLEKPTSTATELRVRPIAVADVMRMLAGELLLQRLRHRMAEIFASLRVGTALLVGSGLAVPLPRLALQHEAAGLPTIAFHNALNTVSR